MGVSGSGKTTIGEGLGTNYPSRNAIQFILQKIAQYINVTCYTMITKPMTANCFLNIFLINFTFILAHAFNTQFYDGDNYHPESNVQKMRNGIPLTDEDRKGWLEKLHELAANAINSTTSQQKFIFIACSALKVTYREQLTRDFEVGKQVFFVHLKGPFALIESRLHSRKGHYMPASLLKSQFETLEEPLKNEDSIGFITVSIVPPVDEVINNIKQELQKFQE
jgi:carbohydrate kinase (thermoresistant glucokinase family)